MKYLMLDTNIYIDMVVSRNKAHKPESYKNLKDLLDTGEIRLLVPKIVINETLRHFDDEIEKLESKAKSIKKILKSTYWLNNTVELEKFNSLLKPAKESIDKLIHEFSLNKDTYKEDFKNRLNLLFYHNNSIILEETEEIMLKANQRSLYKKRPFHYNEPTKDSFPDAIIIETLINIKSFQNLDVDSIVFISRNPKDFSANLESNREVLHDDILNDLRDNDLLNKVTYSTLFTKTLLDEYREEIVNAGLILQFEEEANYEKEMVIEEIEFNQLEHYRELGGLPSLTADYEEILSKDSEIEKFMNLLQNIQQNLSCVADSYNEIFSELQELFESKKEAISTNPLAQLLCSSTTDFTQDEIFNVLCSINNIQLNENFEDSIYFSDGFSLNNTLLEFIDLYKNQYSVMVTGNLTPEDSGMDILSVELIKNREKYLEGSIDLHYGFLRFEDGQAGEGQKEQINSYFYPVTKKLEEIEDYIVTEINDKISLIEEIINQLNEWE